MVLFVLAIQLAGLTLAVLEDSYLSKAHRRVMLTIIGIVVLLIAADITEHALRVSGAPPIARTVSSILGYTLRPLVLTLFYSIASRRKHYPAAWTLNWQLPGRGGNR